MVIGGGDNMTSDISDISGIDDISDIKFNICIGGLSCLNHFLEKKEF